MAIQPSKELIRAIRGYKQGDSRAFEELYKASAPYLNKCILNVVNRTAPAASGELVADILQDTFMTIAEKLPTLEKTEAYFQWAGQIATNHALRTWSKESRKQALEQAEDDLVYDLADDRFIPEDILQNKEKQQLIRNMLQQLPTGQYLCVVEYFYNGLKETEVAQKLGMPLGTVKTNLSRAKKKLRQIIGQHEKKHGVKLYSMSGLLTALLWQEVSILYAGTGAAVFGGAAAGEVTAAAAATSGAAAATAAGSIGVKVCAVIAAAAVTVGGLAIGMTHAGKKPADEVPETAPTVHAALQEPEPTAPAIPESQNIVLTADTLAYMNRIITGISLPTPPTGPAISYRQGVEAPMVTEILIASCTGENGLIQGERSGDGYIVAKADVEAFLMNALGWIPENYFTDDYYIQSYSNDRYLIRHCSGDKAAPIVIHNLSTPDGQRVKITVITDYTAYSCIFSPSADSPYGWILTLADDTQKKIPATQAMCTGIFNTGIVLPDDGEEVLTAISGWGELSSSAAMALVEQYLRTQGVQPCSLRVQDWGLVANGYYTYKVFTVDEAGVDGECFIVGAPDAALFAYDEQNETMTEIHWLP